MNATGLTFRKLDINGVHTLIDWARDEGWNPGPHDADVFWAADPDGFYGYFHNDELIAGGSIVSYNGAFGFMGLFLVRPDLRKQGIGRKLWLERKNTLLARLNPGASIGMDGVPAMQPFYEKGGFEIAFRDERYEATGKAFTIDPHITPITSRDIEAVLTYDAGCFGVPRPRFLRPWLNMPGMQTFQYLDASGLRGFALMRNAHHGHKICPLFADNEHVAEALYRACLNAARGAPVHLDIPLLNQGAADLVRKHRATYVFECARMYCGPAPDLPMHKVFGITTFELG